MLNMHMCTYKYIYTWVLVSVDCGLGRLSILSSSLS